MHTSNDNAAMCMNIVLKPDVERGFKTQAGQVSYTLVPCRLPMRPCFAMQQTRLRALAVPRSAEAINLRALVVSASTQVRKRYDKLKSEVTHNAHAT
jgi:hypothetical protein